MLTSTSADPDGPIASQAWDIDGDGQYDDGGGVVASIAFGRAGPHTVGVRVVDRDGAAAVARRVITVAPRVRLLSPFPVVRLSGRFGKSALRVERLAVRAPTARRFGLRAAVATAPTVGRPWCRKTATCASGVSNAGCARARSSSCS